MAEPTNTSNAEDEQQPDAEGNGYMDENTGASYDMGSLTLGGSLRASHDEFLRNILNNDVDEVASTYQNSQNLGSKRRRFDPSSSHQKKGARKRGDDAWTHVTKLGSNRFKCNYCGEEFTGNAYRIRGHIEAIPNRGIKLCSKRIVGETSSQSAVNDTESIPDYETEIEGYMSRVRDSWSITGCTALGYWDHNGPQLNGITVYCPQGVIYYQDQQDVDPLFPKELIQDLSHIESNMYSCIYDLDPDSSISNCPKNKTSICSHSIILCVLNKMHEKTKWLHPLLKEADDIYKLCESEDILPVLATPSENPFFHLHQVIKNENKIKGTLQHEHYDKFCQEGKEVLDAIGPLLQILHVFETFVPNIGYLYEAFDKAQKRIDTLQPKFKVLQESFREMKDLSITEMHFAAAYLNPAYMYYNPITAVRPEFHDKLQSALYYMNKHLVVQPEKQEFKNQWEKYRDKGSSLFTALAIEELKILHPVQWWEKFSGASFDILKRYAIQLLSQQSNCLAHTHTLLHKDKFRRFDNIQRNGEMMKIFKCGENILKPIDLSIIDAPVY